MEQARKGSSTASQVAARFYFNINGSRVRCCILAGQVLTVQRTMQLNLRDTYFWSGRWKCLLCENVDQLMLNLLFVAYVRFFAKKRKLVPSIWTTKCTDKTVQQHVIEQEEAMHYTVSTNGVSLFRVQPECNNKFRDVVLV